MQLGRPDALAADVFSKMGTTLRALFLLAVSCFCTNNCNRPQLAEGHQYHKASLESRENCVELGERPLCTSAAS